MHAQFGTLILRNIAMKLRWYNDGQLGMPATDTIILAASQICYKLSHGLHYNNVDWIFRRDVQILERFAEKLRALNGFTQELPLLLHHELLEI
jgi:hypothetical protein